MYVFKKPQFRLTKNKKPCYKPLMAALAWAQPGRIIMHARPPTDCFLLWNSIDDCDYIQRFTSIRRSSLIQSKVYINWYSSRNGCTQETAILSQDSQTLAVAQIIEKSTLNGILRAVVIDRAPLWNSEFATIENFRTFLFGIRWKYPRRPGLRLRFMPNMPDTSEVHAALLQAGFRRRSAGYQTVWVDLRPAPDDLRARLHRKWRNALTDSEKRDFTVHWHDDARDLPQFLRFYARDKRIKGYPGLSPAELRSLAEAAAAEGALLTARAVLDKRSIAAILILCHGSSATWQAGWTTPEGRAARAHHHLLWSAFGRLRARGITDFDLGGVNDGPAAGIKAFKMGTGGELVTSAGVYG